MLELGWQGRTAEERQGAAYSETATFRVRSKVRPLS